MNATLILSQNEDDISSLIEIVNEKINEEEYVVAQEILKGLIARPEYKIDSVKLKVDFALAKLYHTQNENEKALEILLRGLSSVKTEESSRFIADYAYEIGTQFSKIKNYPKAFEYFRIVLNNSKRRNDSLDISRGLLGVGSVHLRMYGRELADIHKDSTYYYHHEAIKYFPKNEVDKVVLGNIYSNLIGFYYYSGEYDIADEYGNKAFSVYEKEQDSIKMYAVLHNMGAVSAVKGDFEKAKSYYLKGKKLIENKSDFDSKRRLEIVFQNLADLNYRQENYKNAYEYRASYDRLKDSLNEVNNSEQFAEIEAKYNVAEEGKLTEIEKSKRQNAEYWLYGLVVAIISLLGLIVLIYRNHKFRRENTALEFQQEKLLQERKLESINNEAQIKILNATIDGKETERKQIAEILHNSVSSLLSSASLHLYAARIELKENTPEEVVKSQHIIDEAADKIRDLSHKLMSSVLLKFGLSYAIEDLCEKYTNSHILFNSQSKNILRYDQKFEIKIHSIIEELVNNILKHSNASEANIILEQLNGNMQVRIIDNGDGFDINKIKETSSGGLGLTQIDARIKMMNGIFDIKSSKKTGTRIYINVPTPG